MKSYANFDHAGWIETSLKVKPSMLGARVAYILGVIGRGIYNAPINHRNVEWRNPARIEVAWRGCLSTVDFNELTLLVFLCHEFRVRCEISSHNPQHIKLFFSQRRKSDSVYDHHPLLDEANSQFKVNFWDKPAFVDLLKQ